MDDRRFDRLTRQWGHRLSRRASLRLALAMGALVGARIARPGDVATAKGKKVTLCHEGQTITVGKKAKKGHLKHGDTLGACPAPPPPSPPSPPAPPVALADAACNATNGVAQGGRLAQTFQAPRGGQLTSASVFLLENVDGVDLGMEIWTVSSGEIPTTRLTRMTISNLPATAFPGPRKVTATFSSPATVVAGVRYALVVVPGRDQTPLFQGSASNPCPDGIILVASPADAPFVPQLNGDLRFETVVTG